MVRYRLNDLGRVFTVEELLEKAGPDHAEDVELLGDLLPPDVAIAVRAMQPGDHTQVDLGARGVFRIECVDLGPSLSEVLDELGFEHAPTEKAKRLGLGHHEVRRRETGEVVFTGPAGAAWDWLREEGLLPLTRAVAPIALAAVFLTGCYASFTLPDCLELCEGCEISDCDTFCPRLDAAIESETCHEEGEAEWACVQRIGCDFPLRCREEYAAFDGCAP